MPATILLEKSAVATPSATLVSAILLKPNVARILLQTTVLTILLV
jgi:hypothetical protein